MAATSAPFLEVLHPPAYTDGCGLSLPYWELGLAYGVAHSLIPSQQNEMNFKLLENIHSQYLKSKTY